MSSRHHQPRRADDVSRLDVIPYLAAAAAALMMWPNPSPLDQGLAFALTSWMFGEIISSALAMANNSLSPGSSPWAFVADFVLVPLPVLAILVLAPVTPTQAAAVAGPILFGLYLRYRSAIATRTDAAQRRADLATIGWPVALMVVMPLIGAYGLLEAILGIDLTPRRSEANPITRLMIEVLLFYFLAVAAARWYWSPSSLVFRAWRRGRGR